MNIVKALFFLVQHEVIFAIGGFSGLHDNIRRYKVRGHREKHATDVNQIIRALDTATTLYPKEVLCLQRSAVLVKMLRDTGIPAMMTIGAQRLPFKAHAWVEVNGEIVGDRFAAREKYLILEVC